MQPDGLGVAPISDYDALADLFLADEAAPAMKIGAGAKAAPVPAPKAVPIPAPMPRQMPRLVRTDAEVEEAKPVVVAAKEPQAGSAAHIEGVIVGHLPVIASAWVTQYARAQADATDEPVALLRVQGEQVWLDVVLPGGAKVSPGIAARPGQSLKAVLQRAAGIWRRWIVRVDQSAEAELLGLNLSSVALLTGTDEPAVIASYQLIKNLGTVTEDEGPALRLVIMGAGEEKAEAAERSLRRAAGKFLGRTIEDTVRVGKIGSSMAVQVYRGPAGMSLGRMLAILEATETIAPAAQVAAPKAVEIPVVSAVAPKVERASSPVVAAAAATTIVEMKGGSLASRITGLKGLEIECPYAAGVELALGADGRLHLLAGAGESGTSLGVSDAAQRLLTAGAWAGDHGKLLRAACPAFGGGDPVLHVVVREAREARGLLDTGMRVHLLSRVEVGGVAGWVVVDLN